MKLDLFKDKMYSDGSVVLPDLFSDEFVQTAKLKLEEAIEKEVAYHNGTDFVDYGMVMMCSLYDDLFTELFENEDLMKYFNAILGEGCIVYAYTSSSMPPKSSNFSNRVHVDCPRIIPGYITNMGAVILLDDFTEENGATWFLPGSQETKEMDPEYFYNNALRLVEKAGSVWFFNARIWHAGGQNHTNLWRHGMTINMCRPWMKQRIDIPKAMAQAGKDIDKISDAAKQKLGFFAQVPENYEEYYQPLEKRKYRQKVE
jgi:ectoine hydroxylase-related dioxygenase (phytanoyl-CoA dioxygenase family)